MPSLVFLVLGLLLMASPAVAAGDGSTGIYNNELLHDRTSAILNREEKEEQKTLNDLEHVLESSWFQKTFKTFLDGKEQSIKAHQ